ncbi:MAG: hypothetical protein EOP45_13220 [Sphingobacteriaceae bacterium]|nr:MAG: hypothetical protein EOP45_13220 [Sphingobacteriaceae bacterium]
MHLFTCIIMLILVIYCYAYLCRPHTLRCHIPNVHEVEIGRNHYKDKSLILCGLMRDCSQVIPHVQKEVSDMCQLFQKVHVIIVENDSKDNTREELLRWAQSSPDVTIEILGCGLNTPECVLQLCETSTLNGIGQTRIAKMVYLRNLYLKHIKESPSLRTYDYCAVMDMDLIGDLSTNGLAHTGYVFESDVTIDAVATNGWAQNFMNMMSFYDFYAYRTASTLRPFKHLNPFNISVTNDFTGQAYKVDSAFGGFAIYKTSALLDKEYLLTKNTVGYVCEHITLNEKLNMYLDPQFIFAIKHNTCQNRMI